MLRSLPQASIRTLLTNSHGHSHAKIAEHAQSFCRCVSRMAFRMRMRCWCGGNVQGVEYTGVLFNSFVIASDGKEKMWASANHCKPSDFRVMSERTRRQYGGLLCLRVQI